MRKSIPPLSSLIAFEASARLLSFTKAADELGVTQAAVSRQIQELEQFLQVMLFRRGYRSLELTDEGILLKPGLTTHLSAIAALADQVREMRRPDSVVVVGMTSAFGTYWLAPRLDEFRSLNPDIDLRLAVNDEIVDIARQGIDVTIRYGDGNWPGLESRFLLGSEVAPVCHSSYQRGRERLSKAEDLIGETLLCLEGPPVFGNSWSEWFASYGVNSSGGKHRIRVNNFTMLLQAALRGQGIALAGSPLIDDLLESGVLVPALDIPRFRVRGGYYVAKAEGRASKKNGGRFCDWLLDRAMRDAKATGTTSLLDRM